MEALLVSWISENVVVGEALQNVSWVDVIFEIYKPFEGIVRHDLHSMQFISRILLFFNEPSPIFSRNSLPEDSIFLQIQVSDPQIWDHRLKPSHQNVSKQTNGRHDNKAK